MREFLPPFGVAIAGAIAGGLIFTAALQGDSVALAQDQSVATPKDVIFARKILMGSIGENMDELEAIVASGKIDVQHGAAHADSVSVMLLTFPHLFPSASNEWKPNVEKDAGSDTFAAPEVWTRFTDFYHRAHELRTGCDGCHAIYQKKD